MIRKVISKRCENLSLYIGNIILQIEIWISNEEEIVLYVLNIPWSIIYHKNYLRTEKHSKYNSKK